MFALGNSLGSVFEQGGLILGILSLGLSKPLFLDNLRYIAPFMFFSYAVVAYCLLFKQKIGLFEGFLLMLSYGAFLVYNVFFVMRMV
jgi:Ca2+/Na+ antiporter